MSKTFQSLSFHNYRIWFIGALVANVGTWMQRIAQDWLVLRVLTDGSGFSVGVVTALQFAPLLVLTPLAGVLADRCNRRKLLIWTQAGMGLTALVQGILVLGGHAQLWHIYVLALVLGAIAAIDAPARQIFVGEMVPSSSLPNAVALNSTSFNAARLIGPGVSGILIAAVGTGWVFLINAVSFAATIGALMIMRKSELRELPKAPRTKGQVMDGLRYVKRRTDIMVIMIVAGVVSALGLNFQLTSAVMATEVFGREATGYGIVGSVMAIGSVGGALVAARRSQPRVRLVIISAFVFGIAAGINAMAPTWELYLLTSIAVGFCSLTMITSANTAIQMSTEPSMRGRVMALYTLVFLGTTPIGSPFVGWIAETFSARWSVGIGAIASILVAAGAALWAKRNWRVEVHYHWHRPYLDIDGPGERAARRAENLVPHAEEIEGDATLNASRAKEEQLQSA
ncbi:Predicted arabinose efflux permease, MFS family [Bowdeniella nasicola]|uniref:Predicted arabinose efflux permease, MFS family n=1 Tax=Bowdeniella nasicola TaxID=208480 RepID=A0A1H3ZF04_9ACTO|nr:MULTISPECIES: MFS transporter [Bowdeniella]SEA21892.1 Predicted arabinose efflux permease, MFS family [Bowdeniella nasicola]